ncbi:hypothetical protein [Alteribacter populi]|uniref:hypothetical protein n=1 Tax=Alteribacter populi TaxID=2011011 RepID=UPI000BBA7156|nr:hypothetical protein [Alteribacter populi]
MPKKTKLSSGLYENEGEVTVHNQLMDSYYQHSPEQEYNEELAEEPLQVRKEKETPKKKAKKKQK